MRVFKDERGISNLIATLILIAVAVVGGAFAYTAFRNQAQSTTTSASLQVQDLTAQNIDDNTYSSVTVKNTGTQQLDNIVVIISPPDASENYVKLNGISPLDPGQTGSDSANSTNSGSFSAGETYAVRITASTPDGSITKTMTVRVES